MNVLDIAIILLLIMGAIVGFKLGIIKKAVSTVGSILCAVVAYIFMGPVGSFMYSNFPYFRFSGTLKGLTSLNVLLYNAIAFFLIYAILLIIYRIVVKLANVVDKVVKATVILTLPSKILGAIFGFLEMYLFVYLIVFILNMPMFNLDFVKTSKLSSSILEKTPIVSNITKKTTNAIKDIKTQIDNSDDVEEINFKILEIFKDNGILSEDNIQDVRDKIGGRKDL